MQTRKITMQINKDYLFLIKKNMENTMKMNESILIYGINAER